VLKKFNTNVIRRRKLGYINYKDVKLERKDFEQFCMTNSDVTWVLVQNIARKWRLEIARGTDKLSKHWLFQNHSHSFLLLSQLEHCNSLVIFIHFFHIQVIAVTILSNIGSNGGNRGHMQAFIQKMIGKSCLTTLSVFHIRGEGYVVQG
jgi:hypothetical protein